MRTLGKRAGITAPAIYRHFADKQALLAALIEEANDEFGRYLQRSLEGTGPAERLDLLIGAYAAFATEQPLDYELLFFARVPMTADRLPLNQRSRTWFSSSIACASASTPASSARTSTPSLPE